MTSCVWTPSKRHIRDSCSGSNRKLGSSFRGNPLVGSSVGCLPQCTWEPFTVVSAFSPTTNSSCGTEVGLILDVVEHFILLLLHTPYNTFVTVIYHKTVYGLYYFLKNYLYEHSCLLGELTAHCVGPHKVAYCELYDHGDGTFTLNVKPQEAGRHALTIKYGGKYHPSPVQSLCAPYFP
jgi:hypothetical protein